MYEDQEAERELGYYFNGKKMHSKSEKRESK